MSSQPELFSSPGFGTGVVNSSRKKLGLLDKLHLLQLRGSLKEHEHAQSHKLFNYFPKRLIYRLSSLVDEEDLSAGQVFLGFTRDGQFMISYTLQLESALHLGVNNRYRYIYHLYFWKFVPHRPLEKVHAVRLFGEYEISQDLQLAVCQWPTENNKLLVFGCSAVVPSESSVTDSNGVHCYLTVTAVPPLQPCPDCAKIVRQASDETSFEEGDDDPERSRHCLLHAFAIHTNYNLVPPYPAFNPFTYLKIDNRLLINTGYNLISLHIGLQVAGASSTCVGETPHKPKSPTNNSNKPADNRHLLCPAYDEPSAPAQGLLGLCSKSPDHPSPAKSLFDYLQCRGKLCASCEIQGSKLCERCVLEQSCREVLSFDSSKLNETPLWSTNDYPVFRESKSINDSCDTPFGSGKVSDDIGITKCLKVQLEDCKIWTDNQCSNEEEKRDIQFCHSEKENISPKVAARGVYGTPKHSPRERRNEERGELMNLGLGHVAGYSGLNDGANVENEEGQHRISMCVSQSAQYYVEVNENNISSHFEDDDSASPEYPMLFIDVHVRSAPDSIKCLKPDRLLNWQGPLVSVRQLTFDIEQFAHEMAQKICEEAGKKYLAFLDYDVQVIDLCEVSHCAVVLVLMQVQATVGKKGVAKELRSSVRKLFQTGFKFEWNIETGTYNTIDTEELIELNPMDKNNHIRGRGWNPALDQVKCLQKNWYVPRSKTRTVRVMTNGTVFSGVSARFFWAPGHDAIIVR